MLHPSHLDMHTSRTLPITPSLCTSHCCIHHFIPSCRSTCTHHARCTHHLHPVVLVPGEAVVSVGLAIAEEQAKVAPLAKHGPHRAEDVLGLRASYMSDDVAGDVIVRHVWTHMDDLGAGRASPLQPLLVDGQVPDRGAREAYALELLDYLFRHGTLGEDCASAALHRAEKGGSSGWREARIRIRDLNAFGGALRGSEEVVQERVVGGVSAFKERKVALFGQARSRQNGVPIPDEPGLTGRSAALPNTQIGIWPPAELPTRL